jgi:phospholipid/cholesterol/gamma-HCH transport system permease protein
MKSAEAAESVLHVHLPSEEGLVFSMIGPLDSKTTGLAWRTAAHSLQLANPRRLIVDATQLTYCDGAGAALLLELRRRQNRRQGTCEIRSLDPAYQALLDDTEEKD